MTTDEALSKIFSTKNGYDIYGYLPATWRTLKKRFKDNKLLSIEAKEAILKKCGAIKIIESDWKINQLKLK